MTTPPDTAILAGGCFWGMQDLIRNRPGVISTRVGCTGGGGGLEAGSRALLSKGKVAEHGYVEAVARLGRTQLRPDLARAHLLCGEWLRRENRRVDARDQLRAAYDLFAPMGAEAFAERARRELLATEAENALLYEVVQHRADPAKSPDAGSRSTTSTG